MKWFDRDTACATLLTLQLREGQMRGLHPFSMAFRYPVSVIAGQNGSGKSTILAMVACAYDNKPTGYRPLGRTRTSYTFADFFIQTPDEYGPEGVSGWYEFLHDGWRKSSSMPDGVGRGWQRRSKPLGGRWGHYSRRVDRNVAYFGVQRVVPPYEIQTCRTYRGRFQPAEEPPVWVDRVRDLAGRILGRTYDKIEIHQLAKYRLPIAETSIAANAGTPYPTAPRRLRYSGFNMGAGENAVFSILAAVFEAGRGSLFVIDEIELGLHERAQHRLVETLKELAKEFHIQVVCSTHSPVIMEAVPPEGRFFVESLPGRTLVTPGISAQYAAGKLAGENSRELDVFVEDPVAEGLLRQVLPHSLRERITILPIGSSEAVLRQMAARHKEVKRGECCAVLDGDKRSLVATHLRHFKEFLETVPDASRAEVWFTNRLAFLPGTQWPESWMVDSVRSGDLTQLAQEWGAEQDVLREAMDSALRAGRHNEVHHLAGELHADEASVRSALFRSVAVARREDFVEVESRIRNLLP